MAGFDFERLLEIARGEMAPSFPETEGNLALEPEPELYVEARISAEPVEENEPEPKSKELMRPFPLPARKSKRLSRGDLFAITAAFRRTLQDFRITCGWKEESPGSPRITLTAQDGRGGLALAGLAVKLGTEPELEAALLLELAEQDEELAYIIAERAAIRGADGLPDDDMSAALLIAQERDRRP